MSKKSKRKASSRRMTAGLTRVLQQNLSDQIPLEEIFANWDTYPIHRLRSTRDYITEKRVDILKDLFGALVEHFPNREASYAGICTIAEEVATGQSCSDSAVPVAVRLAYHIATFLGQHTLDYRIGYQVLRFQEVDTENEYKIFTYAQGEALWIVWFETEPVPNRPPHILGWVELSTGTFDIVIDSDIPDSPQDLVIGYGGGKMTIDSQSAVFRGQLRWLSTNRGWPGQECEDKLNMLALGGLAGKDRAESIKLWKSASNETLSRVIRTCMAADFTDCLIPLWMSQVLLVSFSEKHEEWLKFEANAIKTPFEEPRCLYDYTMPDPLVPVVRKPILKVLGLEAC